MDSLLPYLLDWANMLLRWLHLIVGIAWIGSSFYFVWLDNSLTAPKDEKLKSLGVSGELWAVHGGGFYNPQKYLLAPAELPQNLHWFYWESYSTWLSGFALFCIAYLLSPSIMLVDKNVFEMSAPVAILAALGYLVAGWFVYDAICRLFGVGDDADKKVAVSLILYVGIAAWVACHLFAGRAAFLMTGAITATIMSANVFLVIIPNQQIVVADLRAGRSPDPRFGKIAKLRSTHNNYLTLPVVFLMLSNHYPLAFGTDNAWIIAALVFLMGVTIRHWFNSRHARSGSPDWTWAATAVIFFAIVWLSTPGAQEIGRRGEAVAPGAAEARFAAAEGFAEAREIVLGRCAMCHAVEPVWDGLNRAPKGVVLETDADIARHAREIYLQAGVSHAMPPGNLTWMEPGERAQLVRWYRAGASG